MANESVTNGEIEAFTAKLNSVDFTEKERSMLHGMIGALVGEGEVEGFDNSLSPSQRAAATPKVNNWWTDLTPNQWESLYGNR